MALPDFTMRQLLESGAHFGHRTQRWNPKMAPYIYGSRNDIHIIDLTQTVPLLHQALVALRDVAAGGGRILFVGTKRQASEPIAAAAKRCAQYYVNHRWLGGTLTNWQTISNSIKRLRTIEETLGSAQGSGLTKKELLGLLRERDKLERSLGGIKEMGGLPNMLFVIDTNKEAIAIAEAKKLGIPVTAILDSQLRSGRHRLSDPRQRRRRPRHRAVLRPGRARSDRRPVGKPDRSGRRHGRSRSAARHLSSRRSGCRSDACRLISR